MSISSTLVEDRWVVFFLGHFLWRKLVRYQSNPKVSCTLINKECEQFQSRSIPLYSFGSWADTFRNSSQVSPFEKVGNLQNYKSHMLIWFPQGFSHYQAVLKRKGKGGLWRTLSMIINVSWFPLRTWCFSWVDCILGSLCNWIFNLSPPPKEKKRKEKTHDYQRLRDFFIFLFFLLWICNGSYYRS